MTAPIRFINVDEGIHVDRALLLPPKDGGLYTGFFKRFLDVALVLTTAAISVPLVLALALLVSLDGRMPFYVQHRIGRGGAAFRMWKLRSMRVDADQVLRRHLDSCPAQAREWRESQKLRNDPRVTRLGRVLRKVSLDELPQLWNVLKGDMSLVGPRPMMVEQAPIYPGTEYFKMRPGLTGLWQVTARNGSSFEARALFDATYAAKQSLLFDLSLMLRTVSVICRGTGC